MTQPEFWIERQPPCPAIVFNTSQSLPEEIARFDSKGFYYKGDFIDDAGEVHRLLKQVLEGQLNMTTPPPPEPTDEEIAAAIQKGADQEFYATVDALTHYCGCGVELTDSDAREVLYELRRPHIVLDYWGNEKPFC